MKFDVVHRAGRKHEAADALYRQEMTGEDTTPLEEDLPVKAVVAPPDYSDEDYTHYAVDGCGPTRDRGADEL